jgi:hypothetical protein
MAPPTGRAKKPTPNVKAASLPSVGFSDGKNSSLNTSAAASP